MLIRNKISASVNIQVCDLLEHTAILYWTYRAELTNDPIFRVNQK